MNDLSPYKKIVTPKEPEPLQSKAIIIVPQGKFQIPILQGTCGPKLLDIRKLLVETGYLTYDPGFTSTASCVSKITYIDGEKGHLAYRGYNIQDLAANSTYMQTTYLLMYGTLPSAKELKKFQDAIISEMMINSRIIQFYKGFKSQAHPMAIMVGVVGALSAFMHQDYNLSSLRDREQLCIKLIAKMPSLAAYAYRTSMGLPIVHPRKQYGYMKNFLYMMFHNPMDEKFQIADQIVKALEVIWVCHADHEQNASTSTVRIAASSYANPFACIAAGIGSLWGPFHGGANQAVLTMLQQIHKQGTKIQTVIQRSKDKSAQFRLMGFGHRVYKNFDPRATIMQKMCYQVLNVVKDDPKVQPLSKIALQLEKAALNDEYFIKRKLYPNIDFYTGLVYKAIGIPKDMFTVLFAVSRSAGWMAQWNEMMTQSIGRISRPRQLYMGQIDKQYKKIEDRTQQTVSNVVQIPKICKLTGLTKL